MYTRHTLSTVLVCVTVVLASRAPGRTYLNNAPITIPSSGPGSPYPSTIVVPVGLDPVHDLTISLFGLAHTWPGDIDVLLVGPAGQTVMLMSDAGYYCDVSGVYLTFADGGPELPSGSCLTSGTFRPTNHADGLGSDTFVAPAPPAPYGSTLSVFADSDPTGTWSLFVSDDTDADFGDIAGGWSLNLTPVPPGVTYQGHLEQDGAPVNGARAMQFRLFTDAATPPGAQVGPTLTFDGLEGNPPPVSVVNGLFTVRLDFGSGVFGEGRQWLEITVDGSTLTPRQELTATPHAIYAEEVRWAGVTEIPGGGVWQLGGNAGTDPNTHFLGTVDGQALQFRVGNSRVLEVSQATAYWNMLGQYIRGANVLSGDNDNSIAAGISAATIAGGGAQNYPNRVNDTAGAIAGGIGNIAGDDDPNSPAESGGAFVGGGVTNWAFAQLSTVAGGRSNFAGGNASFVGGGQSNYAAGPTSTVGGGAENVASGGLGTVGGGRWNDAAGAYSTVGGGDNNDAVGSYSVIPGGSNNTAGGKYSFAAGQRARVRDPNTVGGGDTDGDQGTFVWADSTNADFQSSGPNQFLIRAAGGVGINTNAPTDPLTVNGVIRSITGGFQFPDDTTQTTAINLAGNGSAATAARSDHYHSSLGASDGSPAGALSVDADGKVGIGTATPGAALDVVGEARTQGTGNGFSSFNPDNANANIRLDWYDDAADPNLNIARLRIGGSGIGSASGIAFQGIGNAEWLRVTGTGLLGIGTSTPVARLHVAGDSLWISGTDSGGLGSAAGAGLRVFNTSTESQIFAYDYAASQARNLSLQSPGGKVGVGTSAPDTTLHVATGTGASLAAGSGYMVLGPVSAANLVIDNNEIMARSNGATSTLLLNKDGGAVCIGNGGPAYANLHVESPIGADAFRIRLVTGGTPNTRFIVSDNGGTSIGANVTGPTNGLRVAGNCDIGGSLTKGGGSFKIDHPLDPENWYLYHSFVESPDMKNIYDGVAVTDAAGYASVTLPAWFEALNRDFRYQLTVVDDADSDEFVQAKIAGKIQDGTFVIRTSAPHVEVSWQVTGIRKDAWAERNRIPVEAPKEPENRGRYLHPEAFNLTADFGPAVRPEPDSGAHQAGDAD